MMHIIGTIVIWYIAILLGVWLLAWATVGVATFSKHIGSGLLILSALATGAWLFSLSLDQLIGLAMGSFILLLVITAPFVGYRLLHGGRNMEQEVEHNNARNRQAMGYDK